MSDHDDPGPSAVECHQSLLRPILVFGGERDLVLYTGFGLMLMVVALRSWWGTALAAVLWLRVRAPRRLPLVLLRRALSPAALILMRTQRC